MQVNEQSTAFLTITLLDKDGNQAPPQSARYRINVVGTGAEIRPWTSLDAVASQEVTLTPTDNSIFQFALIERHRVTVEGVYGADDKVNAKFVYEVVNLEDVT